jgi:hypothetical protein
MLHYRLYWINELGHIEQAGEFDAENDAMAITAVERVRGKASLELWRGTQKVKNWNASPVSSPTDQNRT